MNIITSKTRRRSSRGYKGGTNRTMEEAVREAASKPGATRQSVEREIWKQAAWQGNQAKFSEAFQVGIEALREHHIKPADGITVRNIDEATGDKPGAGNAEEANNG